MTLSTAETIRMHLAEVLKTYGSAIPLSSLRYSIDEYKDALKMIASIATVQGDAAYAGLLGDCFCMLSNIYPDSDVAILRKDSQMLTREEDEQRSDLIQMSHAKFLALGKEWDTCMADPDY